jgi:hypothetical protein
VCGSDVWLVCWFDSGFCCCFVNFARTCLSVCACVCVCDSMPVEVMPGLSAGLIQGFTAVT